MRRGELTVREQARTTAGALTGVMRAMPTDLRPPRPGASTVALPAPPDSVLAREAAERATEELSSAVLAHSWRTWQWSAAFDRVNVPDGFGKC